MGTADLLLVFLAALPLPPFPPGRAFLPGAFLYPIHLTLLPGAAFSPLPTSIFRTYDVSRSLERLAWAWGVLAGSEALIRTGVRLRRFWASIRSNGDTTDSKSNTKTENQPPPPPPPKGLQSLKIIRVSPVLMSIAIHLLAWRLAVVPPKPVVDPGAWTWPWDVTGLIGIGGGAVLVAGEWRRLIRLFGWGRDPQTGPSWTLSGIHILLSVHRLLLAVRVFSAGWGGVQPTS